MTTHRLRVLFVDDESRLLDGLRRAMHAYRTRWDMAFALGGGDALSHMKSAPADIVVTDMRMPGIDGPLLLTEIALVYPDTIRVILSGQTDAASALRAMHIAHQFLAKPTAAPVLAKTIVRLGNVRALLGDDGLRRRASAASVLPASACAHAEITRLCADGAAAVGQFADVIDRSPAMTAKLLQLAGSAFVGLPLPTTRISEVVDSLGLEALRAIARDGGLATGGCGTAALMAEVVAHQHHSLLVARIARRIVPDPRMADEAFAVGLLHDVGKLLMLGRPDDDGTHAEVGAYLLGIWGLPEHIVAAVAAHHAPIHAEAESPLGAVARVANTLAHQCVGENGWTSPPRTATPIGAIGMENSQTAWHAIAVEECTALGSTPT